MEFPIRRSPPPVQQDTAETSDAEVVRRVRAGDRDAYRILVVRHQDGLYCHALRMTGSADVASDVVQQALIKGFTRLRSCREPERFQAWLFRILTNACKDHLKSRRRRDISLEQAGPISVPAREDPERTLDRSVLRDRLQAALAQLSEEQREAFLLKHVEGFSYEEMAERCRVSIPALKMRVMRARETLQDLLGTTNAEH